ncbi:MAG: aminotransferase class V-fold PLP-dependent enzyme [Verrucomicrobiota bacterium]
MESPLCQNLQIRLLDGRQVRYVHLDFAATAPLLSEVAELVRAYEPLYGSVHRGSGHPAYLATWLCEQARRFIGEFFGADPAFHQVLFGSNATGAVNKLARILALTKNDIVLVSEIEHSSNDLPWRKWANIERYRTLANHGVDMESLRTLLTSNAGKIRLVAVTGASNVTGHIPPIHDLARLCHEFGVMLFVDCAQLAPHRQIHLSGHGPEDRIDCMVATGHKLGAPYGTSVLILPQQLVEPRNIPSDEPGGGTTDILTDATPYWTASPDRFEGGSPNLIGILAFAKALDVLQSTGFGPLHLQEQQLWRSACSRLRSISKVRVLVDEGNDSESTPIVPFNIDGMPHGLVAASLAFEHGIGIRHGRHCADHLVMRMLGLSEEQQKKIIESASRCGIPDNLGLARASIGITTSEEDIDRLVEAVHALARNGPRFAYEPSRHVHPVSGRVSSQTGEFWPVNLTLQTFLESVIIPSELAFLGSRTQSPPI